MDKEELLKEVRRLRALGREGGYWDFKERYHENKAELLLDIICMANNQEDCDAYIIFGIADNMTVTGVENDSNRKDLKFFSQFLRDKPFAVYVPEIDLQTILLESHEVDVLTIFNTSHTPYYLEETYKQDATELRAGVIYARVNDTNAGKDKKRVTPFSCIEHLWKKRFGIDRPPFDRFKAYLKDSDNWSSFREDIVDSSFQYAYYKPFPEFQIQRLESTDDSETLRLFYHDCNMFVAPLKLTYLTTTLYQTYLYLLDGGSRMMPMPRKKVLGKGYVYYYFLLDHINGLILHMMTRGECKCVDRVGVETPVLIFKNEIEQSSFEEYFNSHMQDRQFLEDMQNNMRSRSYMIEALRREQNLQPKVIGNATEVAFCFEAYKCWKTQETIPKQASHEKGEDS